MKVKELIEELENFDPEQEVMFKVQSGDYWRTELALEPEVVDEATVQWSEYHRQYTCLEDDEQPTEDDNKDVILIES